MLIRINVAVYKPWNSIIKNAYIVITEDTSRIPRKGVYFSGSGYLYI